MTYRYGDVLRYPDNEDYLFMFIGVHYRTDDLYIQVVVLQLPADDDIWEVGTFLAAGREELEKAV